MSNQNYSNNEVWKDIKGKLGYQVSNLGRVRSKDRKVTHKNETVQPWKGKILSQSLDSAGYPTVQFQHNSKHSMRMVHRLVAETFIENENQYSQVNHIDGDKTNNTVSNLEWVNHSMNQRHAVKTGLKKTKLKYHDIVNIKRMYEVDGYLQKEIAEIYNVDQSHISRVLRKEHWDY